MTPELWAEVGILIAVLLGAWVLTKRVDAGVPPRDWRERMEEKRRLKAWRHMHPDGRGWRIHWWIGSE